MSKTRRLAFTGLLTALAIVLPLTMPKIYIPPFSATLASHVPLFIAALISPFTGAAAVVGATIGFLITMTPVVAARAASHIFWVLAAAFLFRRMSPDKLKNIVIIGLITGILPAGAEVLVVIPFGFGGEKLPATLVTVGLGTFLHHWMDLIIAYGVYKLLRVTDLWQK